MPDSRQRLAVLGLGRVGSCLARALRAAGLQLTAVASARLESAKHLAGSLGPDVHAVDPNELREHADWVFICVPDARVRDASAALQLTAGQLAIHTSGALDLDALDAARAGGADVAVFHPLQAFPPASEPVRFRAIQIGIEASKPGLARALHDVAVQLGASTISLAGVDRAAYHAAAVFASNYVVALHAAAARLWTQAGLPEAAARGALLPLSQGAIDAIAQHPLPQALTGPIRRADDATIARHLQAIASDPATERLYRELGGELLRLPLGLSPEDHTRLLALLQLPAARE